MSVSNFRVIEKLDHSAERAPKRKKKLVYEGVEPGKRPDCQKQDLTALKAYERQSPLQLQTEGLLSCPYADHDGD